MRHRVRDTHRTCPLMPKRGFSSLLRTKYQTFGEGIWGMNPY